MRIRAVLIAVLATAGLAACSSSGSGGGDIGTRADSPLPDSLGNDSTIVDSSPTAGASGGSQASQGSQGGDTAAFCTKLEQASSKLGDLSSATSDPSKLAGVLQKEIDYFQELKDAAPAELDAPLSDMVNVMTQAKKALANPSSADTSALQALASKLPKDAQKLSTYATSHCTGS